MISTGLLKTRAFYFLQVTFEITGKYFASFEPGPLLDTLIELFYGMLNGIRAYPVNLPGTAYRRALQVKHQ